MKKLTTICFIVALFGCAPAEAGECRTVVIHTENGPMHVVICE